MALAPPLPAGATFSEAAAAVVRYLNGEHVGAAWAVTRTLDGRHQVVHGAGDCGAPVPGDVLPDAAPLAASAECIPLRDPDGVVLGGLWRLPTGPDRRPRAVDDAPDPLLVLLAQLLSVVLVADRARVATARRSEVLHVQANSDELTGLPNRRGWLSVLKLEEARYAEGAARGSVIVIDLDRLKVVNDELGHVAGDEHLQLAAFTLNAALRDTDFVARLGGDEFGILVAGPSTPEETEHLIRRIRNAFAAAGIAASIGYANYSTEGGLHRTWWRADREMYREKRRHREVLDLRGSSQVGASSVSGAG